MQNEMICANMPVKKVETRDKVKENSKLDVNSRVPVAKLR